MSDLDTSNPEDYCIQHGGVMESGHIDCLASMPEYNGRNDGTSAPEQSPERCSADQGDGQCRCTMISEQTLEEPSDWEQADDCPVHPLTTPTDPTWLHAAVEAGARALAGSHSVTAALGQVEPWQRYAYETEQVILAALPAITGGVADAIEADGFAGCAHNGNEIRWASGVARNFGSEVARNV